MTVKNMHILTGLRGCIWFSDFLNGLNPAFLKGTKYPEQIMAVGKSYERQAGAEDGQESPVGLQQGLGSTWDNHEHTP